jgi:anti-sigma factor RsiW
MSCETTTPHLLALHFGELELATRDAVEVHLAECRACTASFFALKRAVEVPEDARPSQRVRTKLRAAVEQELGLKILFWERALAFSVAAGAVACAILLVR